MSEQRFNYYMRRFGASLIGVGGIALLIGSLIKTSGLLLFVGVFNLFCAHSLMPWEEPPP